LAPAIVANLLNLGEAEVAESTNFTMLQPFAFRMPECFTNISVMNPASNPM